MSRRAETVIERFEKLLDKASIAEIAWMAKRAAWFAERLENRACVADVDVLDVADSMRDDLPDLFAAAGRKDGE